MTQYLPPNLLALFTARPPLPYLPPARELAHERKNRGFGLLSDYKNRFEEKKTEIIIRPKLETKQERIERKKREKLELATYKVEQAIALWDPSSNPDSTSDPYRTLFVARLNYDTTEAKLRREFESYGPIKRICMIQDRVQGKARGYAFIEYKKEKDMHDAYKRADGKRIDGRRVLVDVERGRTHKGWLPRRLGGGLGGRKEKVAVIAET